MDCHCECGGTGRGDVFCMRGPGGGEVDMKLASFASMLSGRLEWEVVGVEGQWDSNRKWRILPRVCRYIPIA